MASGTITFNASGSLQGKIDWSSTSNGSSANTSSVTAKLYARRTDSYSTYGQSWSGYVKIDSAQTNISFSSSISVGSSWVLMATVTTTIAHNDNGTGSVTIAGSVTGPSGTALASYTSSGSQTVTLDTIARYATITSFAVKKKTINTVTLQFAANATLDWVQYMFEGGSWADFNTDTNTITGLSPNTTYKVRIQVRRKDSQLWTASSYVTFTTYDYAKLTSVPNVNIGSAHTITWSNPSGASISLKLCKTDNTSIIDYGAVTGTSKSITPTASTIYALTPNSNTYKARYVLTTTQNSKTYTNYKDFTFSVTNSNPTFSNFTYKDTNATTVALTGNNQILVKGYSNVSATISTANKAVAKNSATMKTYKLVCGSKSTNTKAYSSTADVTLDTINSINSGTLIAYATDSRGNSKSVTKNATYKQYSDLVIKSFTATRSNNGVGQAVTLKFSGTYWANSFGKVTNAITSVKYFYKVSSASSWQTGATTLTYTASNGNFSGSLSVQGDLGANGFDVSKSFNIRLQVTDKLVTKTYDITLGSGTPAIAIYKNKVAIGQKYDPSVNAKLQVAGGINIPEGTPDSIQNSYQINGKPIIRGNNGFTIISGDGKGICFKPNGMNDGAGQVLVDTNGNVELNGKLTIKNITANTTDTWIPVIKKGELQYTQRKFASSKTHTNYNNNRDLLPTMSFLSYWNGAYDSGNNSNLTYCYQGTIQAKPTSLYDNSSGSNGTIKLSKTAANFNYLEVYYALTTDSGYSCSKVQSPNGKKANLQIVNGIATNNISIAGCTISISGTSVTFSAGKTIAIASGFTLNGFSNTNEIKIYKILGYR